MPYDTYKSSTGQLCRNGTWKIWTGTNRERPRPAPGHGPGSDRGRRVTRRPAVGWRRDTPTTRASCCRGATCATNRWWRHFSTGLTLREWADLWTFEAAFGIRTVSAYTSPTADYGMTYAVGRTRRPRRATYTAPGKAAFPYVASDAADQRRLHLRRERWTRPRPATSPDPRPTATAQRARRSIKTYPDAGQPADPRPDVQQRPLPHARPRPRLRPGQLGHEGPVPRLPQGHDGPPAGRHLHRGRCLVGEGNQGALAAVRDQCGGPEPWTSTA